MVMIIMFLFISREQWDPFLVGGFFFKIIVFSIFLTVLLGPSIYYGIKHGKLYGLVKFGSLLSWLVIAIIGLTALGTFLGLIRRGAPQRVSCLIRGGNFVVHDGWTPYHCRLPTVDGGKECQDSSECEGTCVVSLSYLSEEGKARLTGGPFIDIIDNIDNIRGYCTDSKGGGENYSCYDMRAVFKGTVSAGCAIE